MIDNMIDEILSKKCSACKANKLVSEFSKNKCMKDGFQNQCKDCSKATRLKNREHHNNKKKEWYHQNKEYANAQSMKYYYENKEQIKKYYQSLPLETKQKWYNKEKKKISNKIYKQRSDVKEKNLIIVKERYKTDIQFRLGKLLRGRIIATVKKWKRKSSKELLGCSLEFFKEYMESKFLPTMTWDNHGDIWQIDHIKPCISFDLSDIEQQKICFHYTNMQPLFSTTRIIDGIEYIGNLNKHDLPLEEFQRKVA